MRHELHGAWNRPYGPLIVGETRVSLTKTEMGQDIVTIQVLCPHATELGQWKQGVAVVDVRFDEDELFGGGGG